MPEYKIVLSKTAQKQLDKLPDQVVEILVVDIIAVGHRKDVYN